MAFRNPTLNLATLTVSLFCSVPLWAAEQTGPYVIEAQTLDWSRNASRVHASGGVRVAHDEGYITATEMTIYLESNTIEAAGDVSWETTDSYGWARAATIQTQSRTGTFHDAHIFSGTGTRLWGNHIEQHGPDEYTIYDGGFTPCDCPEQRGEPAWKITVKKADVSWRKSVSFRHGAFWADRIPVLYMPIGYIPLLDARQSGLLVPRLSYGDRYGFMVKPGVFVALGDHADTTVWSDYHTKGGWGIETESRARSASGDYSVAFDWFREAHDAPFLAKEGRGAAKRWNLGLRVNENPRELFRLDANMRIISDEELDSDFATDLDDLTRSSALSVLQISKEIQGTGSGIVRLSANQSLLGSQSTGSRAPSLLFRSDPIGFGKLPAWISADLRYDHFSSFNIDRGSPWHPNAYDREARRLVVGARTGAQFDPAPGLLISGHVGTYVLWRDRTFYQTVSKVPYQTTDKTLSVTTTTVAYARGSAEYGLNLSSRWSILLTRPGVDVFWSRPSRTGFAAIEDLDSPLWQTWIIPRFFADGQLGKNTIWQYELRYPIQYDDRAIPLNYLTHNLQAAYKIIGANIRLWNRTDQAGLPRADSSVSINPSEKHHISLGFSRSTTSLTATPWDLGRGNGFADDPLAITAYREAYLSYNWEIWRFFGNITARRRFPQIAGHEAAWVQRTVGAGYHDPCECLRLSINWNDFPGKTADRIDFQIDLAVLGGIGTQDVQ